MASSQLAQSIAPFVSQIAHIALYIAIIGVAAFLAARRFGGKSKPKRQLVFLGVSAIGFLLLILLNR